MNYRVHKIAVNKHDMQLKLEEFLNSCDGEVISVFPSVAPYFLCYGAKIDYLIIVEKVRKPE
jgi:hypothetical protein